MRRLPTKREIGPLLRDMIMRVVIGALLYDRGLISRVTGALHEAVRNGFSVPPAEAGGAVRFLEFTDRYRHGKEEGALPASTGANSVKAVRSGQAQGMPGGRPLLTWTFPGGTSLPPVLH